MPRLSDATWPAAMAPATACGSITCVGAGVGVAVGVGCGGGAGVDEAVGATATVRGGVCGVAEATAPVSTRAQAASDTAALSKKRIARDLIELLFHASNAKYVTKPPDGSDSIGVPIPGRAATTEMCRAPGCCVVAPLPPAPTRTLFGLRARL